MKLGSVTLSRGAIIGILVLIVCVVVALWFTIRTVQERAAEANNAAKQALLGAGGEGAPVYTGLYGEDIKIDDLFGSVLIVNSWASWSPLSQQELVDLNAIAGEYKDKNVRVVALNRKETKEQALRFIESLPALDNLIIVIDTNDHFYGTVGGYAMPETMFYDTAGKLVTHERTVQTQESLRTQLEALIAAEQNS
jgi:thiol-disulfide isomerase/thioredoxin